MDDRVTMKVEKLNSGFYVNGHGNVAVLGLLRAMAPVVGCCGLLALGAHVRIPVPGTPVPVTLQLLALLLTGFALSRRQAVSATVLYVVCGTAGLPAFSPESAGLFGPTGGYIVGFVVGVWLLGTMKGGDRAGFFRLLWAGAAAASAVFLLGISWLVVWYGGDVRLGVTTGLVPFLPKAFVELLLAVAFVVSWRGWRRARATHDAL